jgi:hypothetical protein
VLLGAVEEVRQEHDEPLAPGVEAQLLGQGVELAVLHRPAQSPGVRRQPAALEQSGLEVPSMGTQNPRPVET